MLVGFDSDGLEVTTDNKNSMHASVGSLNAFNKSINGKVKIGVAADSHAGKITINDEQLEDFKQDSYSKLASILHKAKLERFEQNKKQEIVDMATYTPMFIVPHFLKGMVYHVMYILVLGPMFVPIFLIFESYNSAKYYGFIPSTNGEGCFYFLVQTMQWMMLAGATAMYAIDRMQEKEEGQMQLDSFPFVVMILLALSRCGIISVRYATTHKLILEQMNNPTMTREAYRERLMRLSWITMPPEVAMHEVDMGMIRVGTNSRFYKFKTLTPIYPTMVGKLTDPHYWEEIEWSQSKMLRDERKELAELEKSINLFKICNQLTREEVMKKPNLPQNFELSYDYLAQLVYVDENFDQNLQIDGRLWLRELFLQAQCNMMQLNPIVFSIVVLLVIVPYNGVLVWMHWDERENFTIMTWMFYGLVTMSNFLFLGMDGAFMFWAFWDAQRRIYLMRQASKSLESFHQKDPVSLKMPVINFLDRRSLISWLETRKMILEIGSRFQVRIQYWVSYHLILFIGMALVIFLAGGGLISFNIFTVEQWVFFALLFVFLGVQVFMVLMPNAYLNQEMEWQIKRLLSIKQLYLRILGDDEFMKANPFTISSRLQQLALMSLRQHCKGLHGEEKWQAMQEEAQKVYDALTEAVDVIEKDITFNPREFLGMELWPDSIYGWATTLVTIGFGIFQAEFTKMQKSE